MSDERWLRIETIFHEALSLPHGDRDARVRERCEGDAALHAEVRALLESDAAVEGLMARAPPAPADALPREPPYGADPWLGRVLGSFRLESVLGRGGMGVVYLARREQPLSQTVAVKVIARHLRGSPAVAQFLAERDVLGRLEHAHIARLVDGGIEDGVPYVAMEYVAGRRLDEVCDDPATSVTAKLGLMLQLCDAVAYVHGQLILHRDLKPGNVMVTDSGAVKLLDFGTLKLIDIEAADSLMTQAGMRSLTLRYASPEYLAGRPVSTATDIYSLGVILYRLLAGRTPREAGQPVPALPHAALAAGPRLRTDLDAIIAKALRAEPGARYSSVDAFAQDLRDALADRPVQARRGTLRYRAGKFVARHRAALPGTAAVLLVLAAGVLAVRHEGAVATQETRRAEAGLEDERRLAHLLLFDYFEQLKRIPGSTDAQHRAVTEALAYLDGLVQGAAASVLTQDRADAYTKLGNLLGNPYEENIGDSGGAVKTLQKAVLLSRQLLADRPHDLGALQSFAMAAMSLGRVYFGAGDPQHALQYLEPAAAISRQIADTAGVDAATIAQAASVVDSLGDVYGQEGAVTLDDPATAIVTYEQAQTIDALGLSLDAGCARCRRGVALEYWKLGMLTESIDQDRAAALYGSGLRTLAQFPAADQSTTRVRRMDTVIRQRLGTVLIATGRGAEGIDMLRDVQHRFQGAVAADPTDARARFDLAAMDNSLADAYEQLVRPADALAADREYLDTMTVLMAQDPQNPTWRYHAAEARIRLGLAQRQLHEAARGAASVEEGLAVILPLAQAADADVSVLRLAAGTLNTMRRDPQLALKLARRAVAGEKRASTQSLIVLARAERAAGHRAEAHAAADAALRLLAVHPNSLGHAGETAAARALTAA